MAIQITSDTVVKILVRRGTDSDRVQTVLTEGELGYSVDTRRLYVGDGITQGGIPAGNIHFGFTSNRSVYSPFAQNGDAINDSGKNYLYQNGTWASVSPVLYIEPTNGIQSIEEDQSATNRLRVSPVSMGEGLSLDYSVNASSNINNTIQKQYGQVQFDARYLSLCAASNSFYVGNIFNKQVSNNLNAKLNVESNIFVNDSNVNPYQIQIYAKDPKGTSNSLIEAISGGFVIKGNNSVGLLNGYDTTYVPQVRVTNNGQVQLSPNNPNQSYQTPGNFINGITRSLSTTYFDNNVYVYGTLITSNLSTVNTFFASTTSLSVVNNSAGFETALIASTNPSTSQNILRVAGDSGAGLQPYMIVKDSTTSSGPGIVAINTDPGNFSTYSLLLSGSMGVNTIGVSNGTDKIYLRSNDFSLVGGAAGTGNVSVSGTLRVTGDVVAYTTSDIKYKENVKIISNALDKLNALRGVEFDWKPDANFRGHDVGVIAQDVESICPEIVVTRENGYKAVRYDKLIPLIIEAIKELQK